MREDRLVAGKLIVVGVDGSAASGAALRWAAAEARLRDAPILAVHAWWAIPQLASGAVDLSPADWQTLRDTEAKRFVEEFVEQALGADRDSLEISTVAVQGVTAAGALIEASKDADLLVVGSHGLGGFEGLLLGSVSQQCAHHAACPVVVVRDSLWHEHERAADIA
jgi:nucleotide-binding universal stress UspA family protein